MQNRMKNGQGEMRAHVESQVQGMKEHVNRCSEKVEDIQVVNGEIEEVKDNVQRKITEVEDKVKGKISVLE
ncbi:hypothetical protein AVEN_265395-1 [Araneus ventricosus]|uniref:Uncharacterized protein n=1 Tax=Araneus ventricosus TaxID=182803 RepID=A0A4Y2HQB6_ARAVE|nr:hypothetical protein AVEN_265395-1 [Araneus ventricosus]